MTHLSSRAALGLCLVVLAAGNVLAADPVVWRTDYAAARKEADQKNLPLLVVVGTEQCFYCKKLETVTFADKDTVSYLAGRFVALKLDANKDPEIAQGMRVTLYPTTVIAGSDGKIYAYLAGYQSPDQFLEHAKKAVALIPPAERVTAPSASLASRTKPESAHSVVAAPVKAVGPTDPPAVTQTAKEMLAGVKEAYRTEKYADCLDRVDALVGSHPGTAEADAAKVILASVTADPERLATAGDQLDERFAARYYAIGEAWGAKGRGKEAIAAFEKVLKLAPNGRWADLARSRLPKLYSEHPTIKAER
jgi:thioredoxin-like negative regulator of GroEL